MICTPNGRSLAIGRMCTSVRPSAFVTVSATRRAVTAELKKIFAAAPFIVDIDDSIGEPRPRLRISID